MAKPRKTASAPKPIREARRLLLDAVSLYRDGFMRIPADDWPDFTARNGADPAAANFIRDANADFGESFLDEWHRNTLAGHIESAAVKLREIGRIDRLPGAPVALSLLCRALLDDFIHAVLMANLTGAELVGFCINSLIDQVHYLDSLKTLALPGHPDEDNPAVPREQTIPLRNLADKHSLTNRLSRIGKNHPDEIGFTAQAWKLAAKNLTRPQHRALEWTLALFHLTGTDPAARTSTHILVRDTDSFVLQTPEIPYEDSEGEPETVRGATLVFLLALKEYAAYLGGRQNARIDLLIDKLATSPDLADL